jgi:hypothetical protein
MKQYIQSINVKVKGCEEEHKEKKNMFFSANVSVEFLIKIILSFKSYINTVNGRRKSTNTFPDF